MRRSLWATGVPILLFLVPMAGCENPLPADAQEQQIESLNQELGTTSLAPLLPATSIPRFASPFRRLLTYVPNIQRDATGKIIGQEFNVEVAKTFEQQLPPGFPQTFGFGYGGETVDQAGVKAFRRTIPGPIFEQVRGRVATIHYDNDLLGPHPFPVDPTLDWANPNNFPKPLPPFLPFPPGYPQAQAPITFTTHTHGIEVKPEFDGTPDTWFTENGITGPEFVSTTYTQPSSNESTAFWYHDHSFGVTRLDVYAGLSGFSILRDPNNPLDQTGNSRMLGFEDPYDWSSTQLALGQDTRHTDGSFSMSMKARGYKTFKSSVFALTGPLASTITLDFLMPTTQPNPWWLGAVQLYVDCPSRNVYNAYVGQVELTGKPLNTFNRLSFPVSWAIKSSIDTCKDFDLSIAVNVPENATGTYLIDNLRGIPLTPTSPLPQGEFEVPMIVQDRSYRTDGSAFYPTEPLNPDRNAYWTLFFDGTTNAVNGRVWPNLDVKRHQYRFRILNSANQRFYTLSFSNGMPFKVIGSDGGYLRSAQTITEFRIGVTERVDILVDFEQLAPGTKVVLQNTEVLQPPIGNPPDPNTDGTVMQFTVLDSAPVAPRPLPATLNTIATLTPNRPGRTLVQNVQLSAAGGILQAELDGQLFHTQTTEMPAIGTTEDWTFVNTTPLDHNKHVHLIEFLLVDRVPIDAARYRADWVAANGEPPFSPHPTIKLPIEPYITGPATGPRPEESGWKDTIRTPAGHATRIRIRWAPQSLPTGAEIPGVNQFVVDPIYSIGYVWHCHLVEHEDNEMIRPMGVIPFWKQGKFYGIGNRSSPGIYANVVDFNGVDYLSQVPHTSLLPPPQEFNLWERVNNMNGDWAVQIVYQVGDRARFMGHIYQALQQHKATLATQPNVAPAFWQLIL